MKPEAKSIKVDKLRAVLGEEAFKAVMTQMLREDAKSVLPWHEDDIKKAIEYLDNTPVEGDKHEKAGTSVARRHAFSRLALKFLSENSLNNRRFREFCEALANRNLDEGYTCDLDGTHWKTKTSLQTHKMWHTRDNSGKVCPVCGTLSKNLGMHIAGTKDTEHQAYRESQTVSA